MWGGEESMQSKVKSYQYGQRRKLDQFLKLCPIF